jgi:hypothetical protein
LSESWNNNFIGGYDKQIERQRVARWRFIPTIDIKNGQPNALPATGYTTGT